MSSDLTIDIWKTTGSSSSSSSYSCKDAVLGIDLGTSTSCMAIWDRSKSRAKIIKNSREHRVTPSIICMNKSTGVCTIGDNNTSYEEDSTITVIRNWKRMLLESSENIEIAKGYHTFLLKYLKQCAEQYLQKKPKLGKQFTNSSYSSDETTIERLVIGIPVTYPEESVEATKQAALDAGFNEVVVMHESMAAAAAYGLLVAGTKTAMV